MKEALAIRSSIECLTYVKSLTTAGSQMNSIRSVLCDRVWNWTVQSSITLLKVIEVQRDTDTHQTQTELSLNVGLLIKQADDNTFAHLSAVGEEIRTRDKWLCELPWRWKMRGIIPVVRRALLLLCNTLPSSLLLFGVNLGMSWAGCM